MFRGNHPTRVDEKGRLKVPAEFKRVIDEKYGQQLEMDGEGRLLLPQLLRETGQIKGEVAVLGNLTYLVVRNLELFKREIEEEKFTPDDEKTLDELGI